MSGEGIDFLVSRGRPSGSAMSMLDMAGRQAPAPDPMPALAVGPSDDARDHGQTTPGPVPGTAVTAPRSRIMLSWGPDPGSLMVSLETAPEWDLEDSWQVSRSAAREFLPILNAITKVRDVTGELKRALGPQAIPDQPTNAATGQGPARKPAARAKANTGRGSKNRTASSAVDKRSTPRGPHGQGQVESLVSGAEASVPQAVEQGG